MIKEKIDIMSKPWQVNTMIDMIYKKKDIIILAGTRSGKRLLYQLILLIKQRAIILVILSTIALITNQVYLPIITFYCKL